MRTFQVYTQVDAPRNRGGKFFKTLGEVQIPGGPGGTPDGSAEAGEEALRVFGRQITDVFAVRWLSGPANVGGITVLRRVDKPLVERVF